MIKKIITPEIGENEEAFININNFKDIFDIENIVFYEVNNKEKNIVINFFDKNKKRIIPKTFPS